MKYSRSSLNLNSCFQSSQALDLWRKINNNLSTQTISLHPPEISTQLVTFYLNICFTMIPCLAFAVSFILTQNYIFCIRQRIKISLTNTICFLSNFFVLFLVFIVVIFAFLLLLDVALVIVAVFNYFLFLFFSLRTPVLVVVACFFVAVAFSLLKGYNVSSG